MSRSMIAITCILGSLFIFAGASATGSPQPGLWVESDAPAASTAGGIAWGTEEAPEAASDDRKLLSSSRLVQVGWNSGPTQGVRDLLGYTWSTGPAAARPRDRAAGGVSWNGRKLLGWLWSGNAVERPRAEKKSNCVGWNCRKLKGYPSGVEMESHDGQIAEQGVQDDTVDGNDRRLQGYAWAGRVVKAPNPKANQDCNDVNCRKLQGYAWSDRGVPDGRLVAGPADCIGANCRRLSGYLRSNNDVVARPRVKCQGVGWNCR